MANRYFIDTEFIEDGRTIDLISIGVVCDDGRHYYAVSRDFNAVHLFANPWLVENVVPHLPLVRSRPNDPWSWGNFDQITTDPAWKHRSEIRADLLDFIEVTPTKPQFWGYYADYDWVAVCQLFGKMIDLPNGWPKYCLDLKQLANTVGIDCYPQPEPGAEHNALADAQWNADCFKYAQQVVTRRSDNANMAQLENFLGL